MLNKKLCTGCSACISKCKYGAIELKQDNNGFFKAFINETKCKKCGTCKKTCPLESERINSNKKTPKLYAFNTDARKYNSSATAGGFQIIAEYFIKNNGKVVGAAWDENWNCKHILVDNKEDLKRLYKSKYVQSYMGNIYEQTKQELENGFKVLFSGLPCQIAGLYVYLEKQYENLYTIDLLCNNAPSQMHFKKYLEEEYEILKIKDINFRYKPNNDYPKKMNLKIETKDGNTNISECWTDKSYYQAFVSRMLIGKHCENCHFAKIPRIADITLGDIFGAEQINKNFIGLKSESILINSSKGNFLFEKLQPEIKEQIEVPIQILISMHPALLKKWPAYPSRNRFFDLLKKYSLKKAFNYAFEEKFDIGVVGVPTNPNYGGALTYFALKKVLEDLNKTVLLISPPGNNTPWLPKKITNFKNNPYKDYELTYSETKNSMKALNDKCDIFMTGSDQLFSTHFNYYGIYNDMDKFSSLDWVDDSKKKVAFSASFGQDELIAPSDIKKHMVYYLRKFDNFSVREKSAVALCKKEFNIDADFVLDPVFLCDKKYYEELIKDEICDEAVFSYILDKNDDAEKITNFIADYFDTSINNIDDVLVDIKNATKIETWLAGLMKSKFIVTNSFHAICFAIIFNKEFVAIRNTSRGNARYKFLDEFNLQDRIVDSFEDFICKKNLIQEKINWTNINNKVSEFKNHSMKVLNNMLNEKKKFPSVYEILINKIDNLNEKLNSTIQNNVIHSKFNMAKNFKNKITKTDDLYDIFISVHDQDLILQLEQNNIFRYLKDYKYLFLGDRPTDKLDNLKDKVIVARELDDNIEHQKSLFDYTGWYALVKNNLITKKYVTVIHYDCLIFKNFEKDIKNTLIKHPNDFVNFQPHLLTANYFLNELFASSAIKACNEIYNIDIKKYILNAIQNGDEYWPAGGSFTCSKLWLENYINWIELIKHIIMQDKMAAHNIERTFKFFNLIFNINEQHLQNVMEHIYNCSHNQNYNSKHIELLAKKRFQKYINGELFDEIEHPRLNKLKRFLKAIYIILITR